MGAPKKPTDCVRWNIRAQRSIQQECVRQLSRVKNVASIRIRFTLSVIAGQDPQVFPAVGRQPLLTGRSAGLCPRVNRGGHGSGTADRADRVGQVGQFVDQGFADGGQSGNHADAHQRHQQQILDKNGPSSRICRQMPTGCSLSRIC